MLSSYFLFSMSAFSSSFSFSERKRLESTSACLVFSSSCFNNSFFLCSSINWLEKLTRCSSLSFRHFCNSILVSVSSCLYFCSSASSVSRSSSRSFLSCSNLVLHHPTAGSTFLTSRFDVMSSAPDEPSSYGSPISESESLWRSHRWS
jgi:hypothetical protein